MTPSDYLLMAVRRPWPTAPSPLWCVDEARAALTARDAEVAELKARNLERLAAIAKLHEDALPIVRARKQRTILCRLMNILQRQPFS